MLYSRLIATKALFPSREYNSMFFLLHWLHSLSLEISFSKLDPFPVFLLEKLEKVLFSFENAALPELGDGGWIPTRNFLCHLLSHVIFRAFVDPFSVSSTTQSCLILCDPMDCSTPDFPVLHCLPELAQTYVHQVGDAIQPCHPLSSPSPPAFSLSQHQGLFQWVSSSHQVPKVLGL